MAAPPPAPLAVSTFDTGDDGWTTTPDATCRPRACWSATEGNPPGSIYAADSLQGIKFYYLAPATFLGNVAAAYQQHLTFDMRQDDVDRTPTNDADVVLVGAGIELVFDTPINPPRVWHTYDVPLDETAGWRKGTVNGPPPTAAEMRTVLSSLTQLRIRGDYIYGQATSYLDNVVLGGPEVPQDQRCFPETGQCISGRFREFWEQNGGLPVFGFPITPAQNEVNPDTSQTHLTQWFEHNRFELHTDIARPYDVLLGRLGDGRLKQLGRDWQTFPKGQQVTGCLWFTETSHSVCEPFKSYWEQHGLQDPALSRYAQSLALFGLPLSEPAMETNTSGDLVSTQWFERARFECHPNNAPEYRVLLGLLGNEIRNNAPIPAAKPAVNCTVTSPSPPPPTATRPAAPPPPTATRPPAPPPPPATRPASVLRSCMGCPAMHGVSMS